MSVANSVERAFMGLSAEMGCIVCRALGWGETPAQYHHARSFAGAGERAPHVLGYPLCPIHHQGGGSGVSYHDDRPAFERLYGSDVILVSGNIQDVMRKLIRR